MKRVVVGSVPDVGLDDFDRGADGQIAVRMRQRDLLALRREAGKLGVGHTTLVRTIIEKWLAGRGTPACR